MGVTFCEAIAREEGFYSHGTRPQRNNNPGDLEFHPWQERFGATLETGPDPRFAAFPTVQQGFAAMSALLVHAYAGLTISQAILKWAPSSENNTNQYIANVCTWTQLTPETVLIPQLLQPPSS